MSIVAHSGNLREFAMGVRLKGVSYGLQRVLYIHGYVCEHEAGNVNGIFITINTGFLSPRAPLDLEIDTLSKRCIVRKIN